MADYNSLGTLFVVVTGGLGLLAIVVLIGGAITPTKHQSNKDDALSRSQMPKKGKDA